MRFDRNQASFTISATACEFNGNLALPNLIGNLDSIQCSAGHAVSRIWRGTLREKMYAELGWKSLGSHRWSRRLTLSYEFINNLALNCNTNPTTPLRQSRCPLRKQDAIWRIRRRTEKFHSTFYPHCLSEWNKLDAEIRLAPSTSAFTTNLLSKFALCENLSLEYKTTVSYPIKGGPQ